MSDVTTLLLHGTGTSISYFMGLLYKTYDVLKSKNIKFQCISGSCIAALFFCITSSADEYFKLCIEFINKSHISLEMNTNSMNIKTLLNSYLDYFIKSHLLNVDIDINTVHNKMSIWVGDLNSWYIFRTTCINGQY